MFPALLQPVLAADETMHTRHPHPSPRHVKPNAIMLTMITTASAIIRVLPAAQETFGNESHEKAWFIRVTINACKDLLKSIKMLYIFTFMKAIQLLKSEIFSGKM